MHLAVRPPDADDAALLVRLLDAAYGNGYLPTFDRDGPLQPNDLWWVQAEKEVSIIEIDHQPAGLLLIGRGSGQWLVEDLLLQGFGDRPARAQEALVQRMTAHLTALFQRGRQAALLLRAAETNAFCLTLARSLGAVFANALLAYRYHGPKKPALPIPEGYQIRRAGPTDARSIVRLAREVLADRAQADELERSLASKDSRGFIAAQGDLLVGFGVAEKRAGRGDWLVGVRESHRRRGVGRALAGSAVGALHSRDGAHLPRATAWALDPAGGAFLRAVGFGIERTFLYLEKAL